MNVYEIYGKIGPWATPAPAAIALSGRLYGEWVTTNWITGVAIAVFSLAALEVVGGLCSYQMIQASLTRRWGWFWACLLGVIAYLVLGIYALWGVTAWIYVVLAVFVHISVAADLSSAQLRLETVEDKGIDLAFERERTKQAQAAARKAKAEQIVFPKTFGANGVRSDKTNTEQGELQARIYAELEQDSTIGPREMSRRVGCAPSTAKAYIDKWRANQ